MIFEIHIPQPPLNTFIENIVYYSGYCPPHQKEKLLPDGYIDLIIDLTDVPKHVYDNVNHDRKIRYRKGWVSGVRREFITIDAGYDSSMMVVRFRPGRALPFFGFPINEIANQVVELDSIWGNQFLSVRDEILGAETPSLRIATLEQHLLRIARGRLELNPSVDYAVAMIRHAASGIPISVVREKLGFSHKHLISLFGKHVGVGPKYFSSLMQFQRVLQSLERGQTFSWSRIAHDCGYYDQAHFINEFKRFSGLTPSTYLGDKGEYLNYIPLR